MSEYLRACPFCGGMAFVYNVSRNGYVVRCDDNLCISIPVSGVFTSEEQAEKFWNKRVPVIITPGYHDIEEFYED